MIMMIKGHYKNLDYSYKKWVAYDVYSKVIGHINAGDSWQITTASGITTASIGVFNVWASAKVGATVGTAIGGVYGFIIGTAAGVVVVIIDGIFYTEINGKSIACYVEYGIESLLEWLSTKFAEEI